MAADGVHHRRKRILAQERSVQFKLDLKGEGNDSELAHDKAQDSTAK